MPADVPTLPAAQNTAFLGLIDLAVAWPGQAPLWRGLHMRWRAGLGWVVGDECSGKTSLLRALAGELPYEAGRIEGPALSAAVFWVSPRAPLPEGLTARQWLAGRAREYPQWSDALLNRLLEGWQLLDHLDKPLHGLSAGTWRKCIMAAGLSSGAPLTCLDEPVAGLDQRSVRYLEQALLQASDWTDRLVLVAHHSVLPGANRGDVLELPPPA
ncbi:ABC transporter ATP-binding protein [Acidovorax lacteus]|uniref:Cytochrome c biogenesis heme-transporting ATPase CcmA n=1 Tax=Acidovorax lacteus TaxID=1924988 RepID=A0ABP8L650_9BURK